MSILIDLFYFSGGLALIWFGASGLIRGATALGERLGLSPLSVGIFIVGLGTSIPELIVTYQSGLNGLPELAIGNIIGSNIGNILLVLALPALICPISTKGSGNVSAILWVFGVTAMWVCYAALSQLGLVFFAISVIGLVGYLSYTYSNFIRLTREDITQNQNDDVAFLPINYAIPSTIFGLVALPIAAHLVVQGGAGLASSIGVSDEVIGLTLLAVGTSLPEISAGIAAAFRQRTQLVLGSVLGSNVFNIFGAGAIISLFGPISFSEQSLNYSHLVMFGVVLLLMAYTFCNRNIGRLSAVVFLGLYAVYILGLVQGVEILNSSHTPLGGGLS